MLSVPSNKPAEPEASAPSEASWLALPSRLDIADAPPFLSRRKARNWSLVLKSRLIPCRTTQDRHRWQLLVPAECFAPAIRELRQYERENRGWPPPPPEHPPVKNNAFTTLWILAVVALFYDMTLIDFSLPGRGSVPWLELGNAHAGKIMSGELWRTCTALTLHADWLHLLGNLLIGGVFIVRLCRDLGSGLGWSLVLASGILGNLINAWLQAPDHRAVGASTAVFGAVGLLAAISLIRYRSNLRPQKRWLLPIAGAFGLLAMLGAGGGRTDLGAHLFGLFSGLALGAAAEWGIERFGRPAGSLNGVLGGFGIAAVTGAWYAAIRFGS